MLTDSTGRGERMNQAQWFPFERNRYYLGKMLTSADFETEQQYINHKRYFMNRMMFGAGIVCGLGVFNLDDLSVLIESGAAIDEFGREIVVESSIVKKLSAISGYESLRDDRISLCLRYKEEAVHPVYAVNKQDKREEFENNRILEGYELFLTDTASIENGFEIESEFLQKAVLFENEDYLAELQMPSQVSRRSEVRILVSVRKKSDSKEPLCLEGILQLPVFMGEDGSKELKIHREQIVLQKGKSISWDYWVRVQETKVSDTVLCFKAGSGRATVGKVRFGMAEEFSMKVVFTDLPAAELVQEQLGKPSLEMRHMGNRQDFIRLADFLMVRTGNAYMIEQIYESRVKRYLSYPAQEEERNTYLSYFRNPALSRRRDTESKKETSSKEKQASPFFQPIITSGTLEIPLDVDMKKGAVCFSEEIPHGLGKGNVYVEVGVEYLEEDERMQENVKNTVYGDPSLFAEQNPFAIRVQTAVKVFKEKGSFQVAAKLLGEQRTVLLILNWIAIKAPGTEGQSVLTDNRKRSIAPVSATASLEERESYYFEVRFNQMEPCRLVYELTEPQSGEISAEGVYTAPSRPGVYEIHIYCAENPGIFTYAYAVVHKKGADR